MWYAWTFFGPTSDLCRLGDSKILGAGEQDVKLLELEDVLWMSEFLTCDEQRHV